MPTSTSGGSRTRASCGPRYPVRQRPAQRSSYDTWRENGFNADIETRGFWNYMTAKGGDPRRQLTSEEHRVQSKGVSGGGFQRRCGRAETAAPLRVRQARGAKLRPRVVPVW